MKPPAGGTTAREATATMRPAPAASMGGTTAWAATYAVVRFRVSIESHSLRSVWTRSPIAKPPTALTRTSMCRWRASSDWVSPAIAVSSATSHRSSTSRDRVAASTDAASRSRSASTIHGTHTTAPSARKRRVMAWPRAPLPPVTRTTRATLLPGRRRHHDGRALDLVVADLRNVELLEVVLELLERLLERRQGLAGLRERRRPRQHVVLHVRVIDAALLDLGHHARQRLVGRAHEAGALLALREAAAQRRLEELVDPSQDRREGAAREALVLLVEEAERDQVRGLELEGPVLLGGRGLLGLRAAVHADDLERLLLEVVRLLGVERQHLEGHVGLRHQDGGHDVGLQLVERDAPMIAVRRAVP